MPICSKDHGGGAVPKSLGGLPNSQGGPWRHKCVACAYELGYEAGIGAAEKLRARVRDLEEKLRAAEAGDR